MKIKINGIEYIVEKDNDKIIDIVNEKYYKISNDGTAGIEYANRKRC